MGATNTEWELEEGIPQIDDPFIQQYLRGRTSLVAEEQKQRHDFTLHKALTPIAATACKIVSKIRARDLKLLRSAGGAKQDISASLSYPDCLAVPQGRERVEKTDLWRILQRMPKGSLLHAHLDTMVDLDFALDQAFTTSGLGIAAPRPFVVESDYESSPFYFRFDSRGDQEAEGEATLWESAYKPATVIPLQKAAASFPDGGESGFRDWVKSRCLLQTGGPPDLSADQAQSEHDTPILIVNSLLSYEPILRACLRRIFAQLAVDGIRYVEIRHAFDIPFRRENSDEPEEEYCTAWCRVFQEEVNSFQATDEGKTFYGARVIWTCSRIASNRLIFDDMVRCILAKTDFPEVICGFDVVAQDCNRPLMELVPILFWFRRQCVEEGVDVPFFFHAGEQFSDTAPPESSAFDAVLLGTRRIGEGLSLYRHPLLTELTKEKKILLECCPHPTGSETSSSYDRSYASLSALLSRGASVSLCNNPAGLRGPGTNDMTTKLWQTLEHCEDVGLTGLAMMAENSIRWSCYSDQPTTEWMAGIREGILGEGVKAARLREWYADFEKVYEWIALEFADEGSDDD